ncbi:MAG: NAD-dependent malic enzyme [Deltaproteobacteria bacterium]|nr:NAD-dependent malic enzyme [Deltaproteobacteria bacterium]
MLPRPDLCGKRGLDLLRDPLLNKGTAFTERERDVLGLRGLLPPRVHTLDEQVERVLATVRDKPSDLERYIYLTSLQDRNEVLFYKLLGDNLDELMPIVYTPTVGQACQRYSQIFRRARGVFVSPADRGRIREVLRNWPHHDVRIIVVTDGERILGLGDLGANGMGIPIGKLALYTACAGIHPRWCLPITIDAGTNNQALHDDPMYMGAKAPRLRGAPYDELVDELMSAAQELYPDVVLQLEDFGNANAFRLLHAYRDRTCVFDDDIQGTAAVALAGIYSSLRETGGKLAEQRFLFMGAGEAGIGIGDLIVDALVSGGMALAEARRRCWFFDSRGLVVRDREGLVAHKVPFAHDHPPERDFLAAVEALRPNAIIGVSATPRVFTEPVVRAMARLNQRPIIFALSNPTSKAECTAEEAYGWSDGRALYASGSPFAPVTLNGRRFVPGQGNNAYIFPGVGLGLICAGATRVTDEMFAASARTLASMVTAEDLAMGRIYPDLARVREISAAIAIAVAEVVFARGLTRRARPADLAADVHATMFDPRYEEYL